MGAQVAERLRVLIVAGIPVGVVVGGVGGRVAMFVLRLSSPDRVRGVTSDDGFTIGTFSLGGTYNLLLIGAMVGVVGAGAYRAVAPWLLGPWWFRRFTLAAGAGAVVGSMLVHPDGVDFTLLGPTWLAIGLFVALPASFGALIGPAVDRVAAPGSWTAQGTRRWVLPVLLVALFPPVAAIVAVAAVVLLVWLRVVQHAEKAAGTALAGLVIRGAWLAVAIIGLAALLRDIDAIAGRIAA